MVAPSLNRDQEQILLQLALQERERRQCSRSVLDFTEHLSIRTDDPLHPEPQPLTLWPHQRERLESLDAGNSEVILKARQEGFTTGIVAPYMLHRAMWMGWSVAYYSVDQQAARTQMSRLKAMWSSLPAHLRTPCRWTADEAFFEDGGVIRAFASTDHAGISYTFNLVVMDEAAFHPFGALNYAAVRPAVARGQMVILSTADPSLGPSGFFHDIYWASTRGETGYNAVFVPWYARPGRDSDWYERERKAFTGRSEEFDAYYPDSDAAAFVARSGLVFPQFSTARHVRSALFPLESARRVVAGVDFGGGDPTAVVILGMDGSQRIHQFAEFYERGPIGADRIGGFISQYPVDAVMCDPSQGTAIATLQQTFGLPARPADNRRGDGLGLVAFLLDNDRLTIDPTCTNSIAEFPGYRWATRTNPADKTRYATSTAVDDHADAHDARRYAVVELLALLMPHAKLATRAMGGRPLARRAV